MTSGPRAAGRRKIYSIRATRPDYQGKGLRVTTVQVEVGERSLKDHPAVTRDVSEGLAKYALLATQPDCDGQPRSA